MSKEYRYIRRIIGIFFIALFCFITFNNSTTLNVKAFSESDVITNTNKLMMVLVRGIRYQEPTPVTAATLVLFRLVMVFI